jgi:imidazolonepropionase-like amidohydrolase
MRTFIYIVLISMSSIIKAQNSFVVKNVKVFDGDIFVHNASVRVEDGLVTDVGLSVIIEKNDSIIDGKGRTLLPAFSNAHVHAWAPQSLEQAAQAGVLNVMDMHGVEPYQVAMRQLKDSVNYARYFVAGYAATAPDGHGTQFGFPVPTLKGPEDAKSFIEDRVKANADYIKIIVEPWKNTLSLETVAAVIKEAHLVNKITVVHVSRLEDAYNVLAKNADGLAHIWWDKPIDEALLSKLKADNDFFVIPTLLTTLKAFESMGEGAKEFMDESQLLNEIKKLHDAGITLLAGTDPPNLGINYGTDIYKELQLLAKAGLTTQEVLKTATSNVATTFGLNNTGFIREGYIADMILVDGDMSKDITALQNISIIWKKGVIINK